jgi:dTDP-4-dehydrorhamnose reductase
MKVVVTGAAGQLGSAFTSWLADKSEVVAFTRRELDLTDTPRVAEVMRGTRADVIVNCAAYNAVDRAEDEAAAALAVNTFAVQSLARAAAEIDATLVHYSTDFVFDGLGHTPYVESDATNPRSVYGQSKLMGEWLAADAPRAYVLRVESLFGGPAARSSIDRIIAALESSQEARVFVDRVVSPSFVDDVVTATWQLLATDAAPGVYHVVNSGAATWYDVGQEAARLLGSATPLVPVNVADMPLRAPRPQYCALSNAKLASVGVHMTTWQDALARWIARVRASSQL